MPIPAIALNIAIVLASLFVLFKAADLLVYGVSDYAKKLGLSNYIIGLVVVALAASAPEMISSIFGLLAGHSEIMFGAILGANMVHLALLVGTLLIIAGKRKFESPIIGKRLPVVWVFLMLPLVLLLDGVLSRPDGVLLVSSFAFYIYILWKQEGTLGKLKKQVKIKTIWKDALIFLGSLAALLLAGRWLVTGAVNISSMMGVPTYLVALVVIGVGATLPDFVVEVQALMKGVTAIAVGDALGSAAIEFMLFFGILALIKPIAIDISFMSGVLSTVFFLALSLTVFMLVLRKGKGTWKEGLVLVGIYLAFLIFEIIKTTAA